MSSTKVAHGMGVAIASGLAASGALGLIFLFVELPLADFIYPFVGGIVAGRMLRGPKKAGALAGALSAFFSFPVLMFLFFGLVSAGLYELPAATPEAPFNPLLLTIAIVALQTVVGALGGAISSSTGRLRQTQATPARVEPSPMPSAAPESKPCVQCGSRLRLTADYCHACGAKQPPKT